MKSFKLFLLASMVILFSSTLYGSDTDCDDGNRTEQGTGVNIGGVCVDPPELPYDDRPDCGDDRLLQGNNTGKRSDTPLFSPLCITWCNFGTREMPYNPIVSFDRIHLHLELLFPSRSKDTLYLQALLSSLYYFTSRIFR